MNACRVGFLLAMLDHVDGDRITRNDYDEGFYTDVANGGVLSFVFTAKVKWDARWDLFDMDKVYFAS